MYTSKHFEENTCVLTPWAPHSHLCAPHSQWKGGERIGKEKHKKVPPVN